MTKRPTTKSFTVDTSVFKDLPYDSYGYPTNSRGFPLTVGKEGMDIDDLACLMGEYTDPFDRDYILQMGFNGCRYALHLAGGALLRGEDSDIASALNDLNTLAERHPGAVSDANLHGERLGLLRWLDGAVCTPTGALLDVVHAYRPFLGDAVTDALMEICHVRMSRLSEALGYLKDAQRLLEGDDVAYDTLTDLITHVSSGVRDTAPLEAVVDAEIDRLERGWEPVRFTRR